MKTRIVKRKYVDGRVSYVIQQKHFLFRWWWVDAWVNSMADAACTDSFDSLEKAKKNLCYFVHPNNIDEVVVKLKIILLPLCSDIKK